MSVLRKRGRKADTQRRQRRAHGNRPRDEDSRLEGRGGKHRLQDIPQGKQPGYDAAYDRAWKGLVKLDKQVRYEMWGGNGAYTWVKRRRRRAAQQAAEAAKA